MADERFKDAPSRAKKQPLLIAILDELFGSQTLDHWTQQFSQHGVWWQKVNQTKDVVKDPQALAAGCFVDVPLGAEDRAAGRTEMKQVAAPVDFFGSQNSPRRPVPAEGEHTTEVSDEFNLGLPSYKSKL